MKILITGGVRLGDGDEFVVDYTYDYPDDLIHLVPPQLYRSSRRNHIYWFGYKFNNGIGSKQRTDFINYVKGIGDSVMPDNDLTKFIEYPLGELDKQISMYKIDAFVYPLSGRSQLVKKMMNIIGGYSSHNANRLNFEIVKSAPTDVDFDWELFNSDTEDDPNKQAQMTKYVKEVLLPAIHDLDYFSLAHSVKPKYRKYIKNFLHLSDNDIERFSKMQGKNILVVDDINTSGATLDEILRVLDEVNHDCNIFVYTLIGKDDTK